MANLDRIDSDFIGLAFSAIKKNNSLNNEEVEKPQEVVEQEVATSSAERK